MLVLSMKKNIRHIALVALFAFLLNVMLPFFAVYDTTGNQASAKQMASLFGEKLLICTGDGFKWVKWEDIEKEGKHHKPSGYQCALCYLAAHGTKDFTTPGGIGLAHDLEVATTKYAIYDYRLAALHTQSPFSSRAPPAAFS